MFYIAFKMLTGDRNKYIGIILGISFASFIMTQQPGIFVGIMERSFSFISDIGLPDIWVMDPKVKFVDASIPLPRTQLYRVAGIEGVEWAKPLYKGNIQVRLHDGTLQTCNLIGLDDETLIGGPPFMVTGKIKDLRQSNSIIVNLEGATTKLAMPIPGKREEKRPLQIGDTLELNDNYAIVVGIAETTRTFQSQPVIFTTFTRATSFVPQQRNLLSYILVKAKPGVDFHELINRIQLNTGLMALTKEGFKNLTFDYYMKYTGIPINFGISVILGFLVGAAVAGQTFYNFTMDNLRYFGVLKAMGTQQKTLLLMILFQALIVGCIGFGIGALGTSLFYWITKGSVLAFHFPWWLMLFSATGVALICGIAAFISIRKVFSLEAAIVFKS
jgi:putative ABC transport system permease protein